MPRTKYYAMAAWVAGNWALCLYCGKWFAPGIGIGTHLTKDHMGAVNEKK